MLKAWRGFDEVREKLVVWRIREVVPCEMLEIPSKAAWRSPGFGEPLEKCFNQASEAHQDEEVTGTLQVWTPIEAWL